MDRLVKPDVKEVELIFERGQKCSTTFKLTNLMHAMSVAVSLTATNPSSSAFSIDPSFSTIPPLSSSTYTISLSNPSDQPPLSAAPAALTVQTSMLLAGKPHHGDELRRLFSSEPPAPYVFTDAVIPVSLVGPHVAEYIISNRIPETRPLLTKAISRCVSHAQLSNLLTFAVECGNADSVAVLMDAGADANSKDPNGKSLVPLAIRAGRNVDVVKVLLASGCRIDNSVDFVLHEAAAANSVDLIELLLEFLDGDGVNSVNHEGRTPIHVAALHGHADVIRFCVSMGGDTNGVDLKGWSPLHCAASEGQLRAVECLLECCCYEAKGVVDKDGKTAFAVAMENGHLELGDLLHWGDVLFRAARVDDVHGMASCFAVGAASVNRRDQNGWTPLHWAAFKGRVKSVEVLIEHGAEVDAVDDDGYTPLGCAVEAGHLQVALLLVARGSCASRNYMGFEGGFVAPRRLEYCFGKQSCLKYPFSRRDHEQRESNLEDACLLTDCVLLPIKL